MANMSPEVIEGAYDECPVCDHPFDFVWTADNRDGVDEEDVLFVHEDAETHTQSAYGLDVAGQLAGSPSNRRQGEE